MTAYYNEIDPYAAQWLRNLIDAGHIAPGVVDERSIEDVNPQELAEFTQCHFFAGVGVWSYALRRAGWPDDRPVWTGSCPCQPFSAAGKGAGFADERHLWPAFLHLIRERRPAVVIGEQVASKDADPWIDLVCADVEALGYAFGAVPFPSAGIGAPHIRDRLYWVADASRERRNGGQDTAREAGWHCFEAGGAVGWMAHAGNGQCDGVAVVRGIKCDREDAGWSQGSREFESCCDTSWVANPGNGAGQRSESWAIERGLPAQIGADVSESTAGPTNGLWRDADWLLCRDGKWRPVEPGTFPLAHGASARVGRLRAYGNAINAEAAQAFIECLI